MPDYGLSLWNHKSTLNRCIFKTFNVAYNNVLKKIIGAPSYSSSHAAAESCNVLLLNHRIALLQARHLKRLLKSCNSIVKINIPFLKKGIFFSSVTSLFETTYNVNIFENDLDVLNARINWMQRHEERRDPCIFYNVN